MLVQSAREKLVSATLRLLIAALLKNYDKVSWDESSTISHTVEYSVLYIQLQQQVEQCAQEKIKISGIPWLCTATGGSL